MMCKVNVEYSISYLQVLKSDFELPQDTEVDQKERRPNYNTTFNPYKI